MLSHSGRKAKYGVCFERKRCVLRGLFFNFSCIFIGILLFSTFISGKDSIIVSWRKNTGGFMLSHTDQEAIAGGCFCRKSYDLLGLFFKFCSSWAVLQTKRR